MIRVIVSYPNQAGSRFDMDYYLNKHIPLVEEKLAPHGLTGVGIEQGLAGAMPGSPAKYQIEAYMTFSTIEQVQAAMGAAAPSLMADLANFTDVPPEIQISKVIR